MKKYIIFTILLVAFVSKGFAQDQDLNYIPFYEKSQFAASWEINIPLGDNFISKTSYNGFKLEYKYFNTQQTAIGISMAWSTLEEYIAEDVYISDNGAISTDMVRQIRQLPILVTYTKFFADEGVRPYVNIGVGANYAQALIFFNTYQYSDYSWGFAARPEIGLQKELNDGVSIFANVSYNYSTNSFDLTSELDNLQTLGFGLGLVWKE